MLGINKCFVRTVQRTVIDIYFRNRSHTCVPLFIARHKAFSHQSILSFLSLSFASLEDAITTIRLLMNGNTFHCLMSLVCNCIQRMEMETISCINGRHISTGDFSIWWCLCDDIGFVQLAWYGTLIRLDTTCDGIKNILSDHLHPFTFIVLSFVLGQFFQDNAQPNTLRVATEWLQKHSSDFRHLHWPPKFPDTNIFQHNQDAS